MNFKITGHTVALTKMLSSLRLNVSVERWAQLTVTVQFAIPILLFPRTWSIGDPKDSSNLPFFQPGKIYRYGETPVFEGSSEIRVVYSVVKEVAIDNGEIIMTV